MIQAHELWSKVSEADWRTLLADPDVQRKLIQDNYGTKVANQSNSSARPSERTTYALTFRLSTRKLEALMKESIKKMQR